MAQITPHPGDELLAREKGEKMKGNGLKCGSNLFFLKSYSFNRVYCLPGKSHGWRSLVGYSPWGRWESDTTEQLHFHFSLSCIGEGNDGPLQCSCLENPRDGEAWWAAVYGVAQSRTRLKWLSSSSSNCAIDEKLVSHTLPPIFFSTSLAERRRNEDGAEVA